MKDRKSVNWSGWLRYYVGRSFEIVGLFLVTASMVLFFGSDQMRPMLALTGAGVAFFFVGWLAARKDPNLS